MSTPNNGSNDRSKELATLKARMAIVEDQMIVAAKLTERISTNVRDHA